MAHRLVDHAGKCRHYHGHRYKLEMTVAANLDKQHMVIDFGTLKTCIGAWLDEHLDHGTMLRSDDPLLEALLAQNSKVFTLVQNPTVEAIVAMLPHFFISILKEKHPQLRLVKLKLWETPNCYAVWRPSRLEVHNG